jgi:arylsulfatase A-like enzyme
MSLGKSATGPRPPLGPPATAWAASLALFAFVSLSCLSSGSREKAPSGVKASPLAPNVLVIVTDDQRARTLSVMPKTRQWFWQEGRRFPRAFDSTPLCCPSRASIFTGLYAHNHGVKSNTAEGFPQDTTLQRYLDDAGYTTAMVGTYLKEWPLSERPPYFDRWTLMRGWRHKGQEFNVDGELRPIRGYITNVIAAQAIGLLRSFEATDAQPWFLYVATTAPHSPFIPARKYADAPVPRWRLNPAILESDRSDKPPWVRQKSASLARAELIRTRQLRTLMSVDDLVDGVFRELDALDERRDTIAFFLSDNGYMWAEHGVIGKRRPYLDSIGIPLALVWPGHVAAGSTDRRVVTNVDIAPTILDAAGISPPTPMDGRSLLDDWKRPYLFTEYWGRAGNGRIPGWDSILSRRFQYMQYYDDDRSIVTYREYYRLKDDPWELRDLFHDGNASNDPDRARLSALIRRYQGCAAQACP